MLKYKVLKKQFEILRPFAFLRKHEKGLRMTFLMNGFLLIFLMTGIINAYALNLEKIKVSFLSGDYKAAILEGEKALAVTREHTRGLDELYYILALSYLKDGNILRASDIFEIILNEFKNSKFRDEAELGLGDTFFLRENYGSAQSCYEKLLKLKPGTKLKAQAYYRLSRVAFKKGDTKTAEDYLEKIKREFPASLELTLEKELCPQIDSPQGFFYSVQVGSFSREANAVNLRNKLVAGGHNAFIEEADISGSKSYRVKAGKLKARGDAVALAEKLSSQGYPAKICP